MRLDKFLKLSRLIKRRTLAKEACDSQKIEINGKIAKAGDTLKVGDKISLNFGENKRTYVVENLKENPSKCESSEMYKEL